jgi:signal transduction histidine kinase
MWTKLGLRRRIYSLLLAVVAMTLVGAIVLIWYTYRMEALLSDIAEKHITAFKSAEALETALANQKGFVSYYFIDNDPMWLRQLGEYRQIFRQRLGEARQVAGDAQQRAIIDRIEDEYNRYVDAKDRVITHYKAGRIEHGARLHQTVRRNFFNILELCEEYKALHTGRILEARRSSHAQATRLRAIALAAVVIVAALMILLLIVLVRQILGPVRTLTAEAQRQSDRPVEKNEINALSLSVRSLIQDVDQTHSELERSREHLLQAEKMAMVGRLAAGMAHSIRNPFTSIKMRLFSLSRSLKLNDTQKEDFEVISEEIRHVDTIVQNFLEFSRPPKLKMQRISPSAVIDQTVQLLRHRLKSYDVEVERRPQQPLPEIEGDPEQLKEALANIMINACEAMRRGGRIIVAEACDDEKEDAAARITISDTGPGIESALLSKITEPFFTTKEEGTGLGLSIVTRIIEEHRGWLDITSREGEGTTFIINLPLAR